MATGPAYHATRDRVEAYFDRTATRAWEALTSEAPVSRIRQTVREGRDRMRAVMLSRLPDDLTGARVLDAGCGTGAMTAHLASRGATVLGVDISPELIRIARNRLPEDLRGQVEFRPGDMLDADHGRFDAVIAMDSLIYYDRPHLIEALRKLDTDHTVFTVAPRTKVLMTMWGVGKLMPRADRSPKMVPHAPQLIARDMARIDGAGSVSSIERVARGFYISECLEHRR